MNSDKCLCIVKISSKSKHRLRIYPTDSSTHCTLIDMRRNTLTSKLTHSDQALETAMCLGACECVRACMWVCIYCTQVIGISCMGLAAQSRSDVQCELYCVVLCCAVCRWALVWVRPVRSKHTSKQMYYNVSIHSKRVAATSYRIHDTFFPMLLIRRIICGNSAFSSLSYIYFPCRLLCLAFNFDFSLSLSLSFLWQRKKYIFCTDIIHHSRSVSRRSRIQKLIALLSVCCVPCFF